jgi:hypothetical protein
LDPQLVFVSGVEELGKTKPKTRGADPPTHRDLRFLQELEDQGVIVQLYRQQI